MWDALLLAWDDEGNVDDVVEKDSEVFNLVFIDIRFVFAH
jgi:hypothetical protein